MYHLKVAIFDKNMAVGKSENLVMQHPYDLMQPSFRGYADLVVGPAGSSAFRVNSQYKNF